MLFSGPMVRAILEGRKTQTRRVIKPQPPASANHDATMARDGKVFAFGWINDTGLHDRTCPYGVAGDRLWVRETWQVNKVYDPLGPRIVYQAMGGDVRGCVHYCANKEVDWAGRKRASIHMPRWASRITLEITGVRVERLQEIDSHQAWKEGMPPFEQWSDQSGTVRDEFQRTWDSLHGKGAWELNPFVWVLEFKRVVA